jgi:hypothetical protein
MFNYLRCYYHLAIGLTGSFGVQVRKLNLGVGLLSRILLILASSSGVNFSTISKDFKLSYNWATVRAPINPESTWGYLRVHAIAK